MIVGAKDAGLDLAKHAINFYYELPNARLVIFEDTGHALHAERPIEFLQEVRDFLNNGSYVEDIANNSR